MVPFVYFPNSIATVAELVERHERQRSLIKGSFSM